MGVNSFDSSTALRSLSSTISKVLLGKEQQLKLALSCLLAGGHLLIEDLPGMGKSTLAEALARGFDLDFKRVSFTSDLLPADLTGINIFDQASSNFRFRPGPIFAQVLLADEINRASPRTQSALLEAMAAGRVSVDGTSHLLPKPFFVIATQNSLDQVGTSALPEAQLDRFLMRLTLGFPSREAEQALLRGDGSHVADLGSCLSSEELIRLQQKCRSQHCSEVLISYIVDLAAASRRDGHGLSPRASQALLTAAQAWSLLEGRDHVSIDDVQAVFPAIAEHRLDSGSPSTTGAPLSNALLQSVHALR